MPRALTIALSLLLFAGSCGGDEPDIYIGSTTTTAVRLAPGPLESVEAELTSTITDEPTERFGFVLASDGSYLLEAVDGKRGEAHDAKTARVVSWDAEGWYGSRNVAPGPPEGLRDPFILNRDLARTVVGLARATPPDKRITSVRHDGRDAWRYSDTRPPNELAGDGGPVEIEAIVDRETGIALSVTEKVNGAIRSSSTATNLRVNSEVDAAQFSPTPGGKAGEVTDEGWETSSPSEAAKAAGFTPVAPRDLPQGYAPGEVKINRKGTVTGPEGSNPPTAPVVAVTHRLGLDVVNVTTRPVGPDPDIWSNPFGSEGSPIHETTRKLGTGAFRGQTATVGHGPPAPPFLWLMTGDVVVTISGPLSTAELVRIAESLEPLSPN